MKTILTTTFVIALMVFAFNAAPSLASGQRDVLLGCNDQKREKASCRVATTESSKKFFGELDELQDPDQADNERDVADSGDEGSTSAAGATEQ